MSSLREHPETESPESPESPKSPKSSRPVRRRARRAVLLRLVGAGVGLGLLVALAGRAVDLVPNWDNPLRQEVVDRSTPPLLLALDDLSEYHAATGTFQVVIDQERDTRYLPSVISGERVTFLATGSVDALVDFSAVAAPQVRTSPDRRSVTVSLPAPQLGRVRVDPAASRVLDRDRGVLDRVGSMFEESPSSEAELYLLAEQRLAGAADESDLLRRAEDNTRQMLTAMARSFGFEQVTVTFGAPA